jgi:aminopeptidase YwaD
MKVKGDTLHLTDKAQMYLQKLCVDISSRKVGSQGNQRATAFFAQTAAAFGFEVETPAFDCMDWADGDVQLTAGDIFFPAFASPYSLGCDVQAPLSAASTVEELAALDADEAVLLLRGDIARQQLMPKNFPFYNPDEHQQIIRLLESKRLKAIIAATSRDTEMVGSLYPFPLIEDGDFNIPSVYMKDVDGDGLAAYVGQTITLGSSAKRIPAQGCNVIARKGKLTGKRIVCFAHIDAKPGTPGASDDASGITILLLLAEMLADYNGDLGIEIVAINGEDYYCAPGEQQYLARNAGRFDEIVLGINIDGAGYYLGNTAYSLYECPPDLAAQASAAFSAHEGFIEGESWYQGDHSLFLMNNRPALAITSEQAMQLLAEIVHTDRDRPDIVDPTKLVTTATALRDLVMRLNEVQA